MRVSYSWDSWWNLTNRKYHSVVVCIQRFSVTILIRVFWVLKIALKYNATVIQMPASDTLQVDYSSSDYYMWQARDTLQVDYSSSDYMWQARDTLHVDYSSSDYCKWQLLGGGYNGSDILFLEIITKWQQEDLPRGCRIKDLRFSVAGEQNFRKTGIQWFTG
jgi:hypothetical protein